MVTFILSSVIGVGLVGLKQGIEKNTKRPQSQQLELSIGLTSKYIETYYLEKDLKETDFYGLDTNIKFYPFGSEHFFYGVGTSYLIGDFNSDKIYTSLYVPIGLDFKHFGLYYTYGKDEIKGLYTNDIRGPVRGFNIYFKFENFSFHLGASDLEMKEGISQSNPYDYSGTSYNTSIQYTF